MANTYEDGVRDGASELTVIQVLDRLLAERRQLQARVDYLERGMEAHGLCLACGKRKSNGSCANQDCVLHNVKQPDPPEGGKSA